MKEEILHYTPRALAHPNTVGSKKTVHDYLVKRCAKDGKSLTLDMRYTEQAYLSLSISDVRFVHGLNGYGYVFAPSEWMKQHISSTPGVRTPVKLARIGIDSSAIEPRLRRRGKKLRFLFLATHADQYRKASDIAKSAFAAAFGNREDVELVMHSTLPAPHLMKFAPNINIAGGQFTPEEYLLYLHTFDALLHPARCEAIGLTVAEAIASGMPAIHSGATGMAEYAHVGLVCGHRKITTKSNEEWREPFLDAVVDRLREVDQKYDTVMKRAMQEAKFILKPSHIEEEAAHADAAEPANISAP